MKILHGLKEFGMGVEILDATCVAKAWYSCLYSIWVTILPSGWVIL